MATGARVITNEPWNMTTDRNGTPLYCMRRELVVDAAKDLRISDYVVITTEDVLAQLDGGDLAALVRARIEISDATIAYMLEQGPPEQLRT